MKLRKRSADELRLFEAELEGAGGQPPPGLFGE
jgi:hypothetical protein